VRKSGSVRLADNLMLTEQTRNGKKILIINLKRDLVDIGIYERIKLK
jgi:hypothetical protein